MTPVDGQMLGDGERTDGWERETEAPEGRTNGRVNGHINGGTENEEMEIPTTGSKRKGERWDRRAAQRTNGQTNRRRSKRTRISNTENSLHE